MAGWWAAGGSGVGAWEDEGGGVCEWGWKLQAAASELQGSFRMADRKLRRIVGSQVAGRAREVWV